MNVVFNVLRRIIPLISFSFLWMVNIYNPTLVTRWKKTSFSVSLPISKLIISLISIYKHYDIDIADPSSMQDAYHMNFVIDLFHRSAESEGLRFDSSWEFFLCPTLVGQRKRQTSFSRKCLFQVSVRAKKLVIWSLIGLLIHSRSKRLYEYFTVFHKNTPRHSSCDLLHMSSFILRGSGLDWRIN